MTEGQEIAEILHSKCNCATNYDNLCLWTLSTWDSPNGTRLRYFDQAKKLLEITDFKTVKAILELI